VEEGPAGAVAGAATGRGRRVGEKKHVREGRRVMVVPRAVRGGRRRGGAGRRFETEMCTCRGGASRREGVVHWRGSAHRRGACHREGTCRGWARRGEAVATTEEERRGANLGKTDKCQSRR
jgi:hypothetical protein